MRWIIEVVYIAVAKSFCREEFLSGKAYGWPGRLALLYIHAMVFSLYTRRGCHLCEAAEDMLAAYASTATVELIDVDAHPDLERLYGSRVPVLTADAVVVLEGRFDEATLAGLMRALTA
jgi:glutaredoxin